MDDLLHLEQELHPEEIMIRDAIRRCVDTSFIPHILEHYEAGTFPTEIIPELASIGLFGISLPAEYGGSGASAVSYGLACQELERGDSGLRSFVSVQNSLCIFPIFKYGSEEQKQRYLPDMAAGKKIGCFGLTEPDSGSDPASMRTTAKKVSGGWKLNGSKMWITNAPVADLAVVWAQTEEGIRGFIVDKETPGFQRNAIHYKMSLRASSTGELVFDDCFVPDEQFLPGSVKGLSAPLSCLSQARYGIAWGTIGAAMACFDIAQNYVLERHQFAKPLASFQLVQKDLADMYSEIVKSQCLNLRIGRLKDQGTLDFAAISLAKRNGCRVALDVARSARNLLGANGISLEYHVIRHMMNLESVFTYEGTDNVHTLVLGRHLTGINAFE